MTNQTHDDGVALWRRIADHLESDILTGRIDGMLEPESRLAARFAANRHTVRRALQALSQKGLVRAERGRGTFVEASQANRLSYPVGATTRFTETIGAAAKEPGGRLVASGRERASFDVSARLGCPVGEPLIKLEMLRVADEAPVLVSTIWCVERRFSGLVGGYAETGTISGALEKCGIPAYRRLRTAVTAESADPRDAERLRCAPHAPLLVTVSVDVDLSGEPILTARTRFAADRIELLFDHTKDEKTAPSKEETT
ncbi:phosphonate metabolism transcriptional regulator PhnF [Fulvimarina sp. MAC3]|uniref:phosphonate metabolism transcriptional regulator PhnF n=1 Tax=Fulvimarina sp. MAC3 TaxID=3148887 RepID=UPI0031FD052C